MDREQMKTAILNQEQVFRQQVHELHRLYHVQKQLMHQMNVAASNRVPVIVDIKPKPELHVLCSEKPANPQQFLCFSSSNCTAPASASASAPAPAEEECNLELTLATVPSTSSGSADRQQGKRLKSSSNSDSGTTAVSSTSTDSELAQFGGFDAMTAARFQSESRRMDQLGQGAWMHQCLSLKTAS